MITLLKAVRNGEALSVAIGMIDGFDIKLTSSVYIGEESGNLEDLLSSLVDDFDYEAMLASEKWLLFWKPRSYDYCFSSSNLCNYYFCVSTNLFNVSNVEVWGTL